MVEILREKKEKGFENIGKENDVLVRIPRKNLPNMHPGATFVQQGLSIYAPGKADSTGKRKVEVIMNRFFYGFSAEDFDKERMCRVEINADTNSDGSKTFIHLNIHRDDNQSHRPHTTMSIVPSKFVNGSNVYKIHNSSSSLVFESWKDKTIRRGEVKGYKLINATDTEVIFDAYGTFITEKI